jgi:hypothetical protein
MFMLCSHPWTDKSLSLAAAFFSALQPVAIHDAEEKGGAAAAMAKNRAAAPFRARQACSAGAFGQD